MELLARLVPLVPRPRINLLIYHGVLAPNAPWRAAIVARDVEPASVPVSSDEPTLAREVRTSTDGRRPAIRPRYRSWAELMRRAFDADVLACPMCGGRMILLATITDPAVIRRMLTHLGLSLDPATRGRNVARRSNASLEATTPPVRPAPRWRDGRGFALGGQRAGQTRGDGRVCG
jgi:hypothetical protein